MKQYRRTFIKSAVSTGIIASLAGCSIPDGPAPGGGVRGLRANQREILRQSKWHSGDADIGNTRSTEAGVVGSEVSSPDEPDWNAADLDTSGSKERLYGPIVDKRQNVLLADGNSLSCYSYESGDQKWSVDLPAPAAGPPAFDGQGFGNPQLVYVACIDGTIVGVTPSNGEVSFETDVGSRCSAGPTAVGGACYVTVNDPGSLVAVSNSGAVQWRVADIAPASESPPAIGAELIYIKTDTAILGIAPDEEGEAATLVERVDAAGVDSQIGVRGETLYFVTQEPGRVEAWKTIGATADRQQSENSDSWFLTPEPQGGDPDDITIRREFAVDTGGTPTGELVVGSQNVYVVTDEGIEAYSRQVGEQVWIRSAPEDGEYGSISVSGSLIFAPGSDGSLYILSTINGNTLDAPEISSPFDVSPTPVDSKLITQVDGLGGDRDTDRDDSSAQSNPSVAAFSTENPEGSLTPRRKKANARAKAVEQLSESDMDIVGDIDAAVEQFEQGVASGEVSPRQAEIGIQKIITSLGFDGDLLLTFSTDSGWPPSDALPDVDVTPHSGDPKTRAREEQVGFSIARSMIRLPIEFLLWFVPVKKVLKGVDNVTSASGLARQAIQQANKYVRKRVAMNSLKTLLNTATDIGAAAWRWTVAAANIIRTAYSSYIDDAVRAVENAPLLPKSVKDILIQTYLTPDSQAVYVTREFGGLVLDNSKVGEFVKDVSDAVTEYYANELQRYFETGGGTRPRPHRGIPSGYSDEPSIYESIDRGTIRANIDAITSEDQYIQAAEGNIPQYESTIDNTYRDVLDAYSSTAEGYYSLKDTVNNWDKYSSLTQQNYSTLHIEHIIASDEISEEDVPDSADNLPQAVTIEIIKIFSELFETAAEVGFGVAAIGTLIETHNEGGEILRDL